MAFELRSWTERCRAVWALLVIGPALLLPGCMTAYQAPAPTLSGCNEFMDYLRDEPQGVFKKYKDRVGEGVDVDARTFMTKTPDKPIIVRYSDSGEISNRCDYSAALFSALYEDPDIAADKQSNLIVVYVHGWRNHSGDHDKVFYNFADLDVPGKGKVFADQLVTDDDAKGHDYAYFSKFVEDLRVRTNAKASAGQHKNVIGIFVSWKGGTNVPVADFLSFWDRGAAADRLARSGSLPRLFGALESVRGEEDQIVFIGHSFGGRILYNVVEDRLIHDVQGAYKTDGTYDLIERNKDLVFLINPAFEAAVYKSIDEFRYENEFQKDQPPLIVTVTSKDDWANRLMFPAGQVVAAQAGASERRAVGFWNDFVTHSLCLEGEACYPSDAPVKKAYWYDNTCDEGVCLWRSEVIEAKLARQREDYVRRVTEAGGKPPRRGIYSDPQPSPFLFVQTEENILEGHGWFREGLLTDGPANERFSDWMVEFISEHNCRMSETNVCGLED